MNFNELFQKMRELDAPVGEELKGGQKNLDADKDGDIEADDLKALRDKKVDEEIVDECGMDMMSPMSSMSPKQQDNVSMNVSMNGSGAGGIRDLLDILRDMEQGGDMDIDNEMPGFKAAIIDEPMDEYANSPHEKYGSVGDVTATGNDIHSKGGEAPKVNGGGNPWNVTPESLVPGLQELYNKLKEQEGAEEEEPVEEGWWGDTMPTWLGGDPAKPAPAAGAATKPAAGAATKPAAKSDPKVQALQQQLIAKGAKIKPDGIMGPATQAAMKQFGGPAAAAPTAAAPEAPEAPAAPAAPEAPAAPTGSAALAPAADGSNAATAIPSGPQTVPGQQGSAALDPTKNSDKATSIPSGPATAAGAPAAAPAAAPAGQMAQLQQMAQQGLQSGQPASTDDLMKQAQSALASKMKGGFPAAPAVAEKIDYSRQARATENSELTAMLRIAGLR